MGVSEFKARCLAVMDEVKATREPVLVTKKGRPVAKLVPADEPDRDVFGCLAGVLEIVGDVVDQRREPLDRARERVDEFLAEDSPDAVLSAVYFLNALVPAGFLDDAGDAGVDDGRRTSALRHESRRRQLLWTQLRFNQMENFL